jgi:mRNA interferase MazF
MEVRWREIRWLEQPSSKARPCLVLSRDSTIPFVHDVLVAPISTTIRGLDTEVLLGRTDGLRADCVANLQKATLVAKSDLRDRAGQLSPARWPEVCQALAIAIGC